MISFEHHKVLIRWDGVFTPLKMEKLRPRELKFLVVHHWMSKEKTSDSSSGLLMLYPALFQQRHIELSLIQLPGGVGWSRVAVCIRTTKAAMFLYREKERARKREDVSLRLALGGETG